MVSRRRRWACYGPTLVADTHHQSRISSSSRCEDNASLSPGYKFDIHMIPDSKKIVRRVEFRQQLRRSVRWGAGFSNRL